MTCNPPKSYTTWRIFYPTIFLKLGVWDLGQNRIRTNLISSLEWRRVRTVLSLCETQTWLLAWQESGNPSGVERIVTLTDTNVNFAWKRRWLLNFGQLVHRIMRTCSVVPISKPFHWLEVMQSSRLSQLVVVAVADKIHNSNVAVWICKC